MRPEVLYLTDIVEAAESIARFLGNVEREAFLEDDLRQSAVAQKFIIIGEAAARLSPEYREQHPEIEWRKAIGLRNVTVHDYFSINWEIIWSTAVFDIPLLRQQIIALLPPNDPPMESPN